MHPTETIPTAPNKTMRTEVKSHTGSGGNGHNSSCAIVKGLEGVWTLEKCPSCHARMLKNDMGDRWCSYIQCTYSIVSNFPASSDASENQAVARHKNCLDTNLAAVNLLSGIK